MAPATELIGTVSTRSGNLVVLDGGLLRFWSHVRPPLLPEWEDLAATANRAFEVTIEGPDAVEAGRAFDRSPHPTLLFDVSDEGFGKLEASFEALTREQKLDARLVKRKGRVPHRTRVDLALEAGGGAGIFSFHGMWGATIGGLPPDRLLPLNAERFLEGPDEGRWKHVTLEVGDGVTARTEKLGHVLVDEARLLVADPDALGSWVEDESLDGLADFVFWGRDAEEVARQVKAGPLDQSAFGIVDVPVAEAVQFGRRVEALRKPGLKFATDFRPHSHPYQLLKQVRSTSTESGVLELAGVNVCLFMTTWGDGAFPIYREVDAQGRLLRLKIAVGDDELVQRQRKLDEWWGPFSLGAIVSARVAREGMPVRFLYRQPPDREEDSGWRVMAGDESDQYLSDSGNAVVMPLTELIQRDKTLEPIFRTSAPCAFERSDAAKPFLQVSDWEPPED